jgi:hypothetical protein
VFLSSVLFCLASTCIEFSCRSDRTGSAGSPREVEHTSAPVVEQTAQTATEEPPAGDTLAVDTATPSMPEKTVDATPADAGLLEHVSIFCLCFPNLYRVREQRSRWE